MRIAIFHDLPSGGAKRSLHESARRLASRHTLDVYTLATADETFCDLRPFSNRHRVFPFAAPRTFGSPFGRLNRLQWWATLHRLDRLTRRIAREIDEQAYDIVFAQPCMWSQAPLVLRHVKTPAVYYCHEAQRGAFEVIPTPHESGRPWRGALDRLDPLLHMHLRAARGLDRQATRAARRVLVNSKFTQASVRSIYGVQSAVCYHGVDADLFRPRTGIRRGDWVLSVGAIQAHKGFDFLINALATLPAERRPGLRLVGNAEAPGQRAALQSLAVERNVHLRIDVGITQADLVENYNEAALVAYAPYNEPFGLVPLEAMACGTPVIGVAEGGVRESVVDEITGRLVPRDAIRFGEAISQVMTDPSLRDRLGEQAREVVVQAWTWDRAVERLEQHLLEHARQ